MKAARQATTFTSASPHAARTRSAYNEALSGGPAIAKASAIRKSSALRGS